MYRRIHYPEFKIITWLNVFIMVLIQALTFVSVADAAKHSAVEYSRQQLETTVYLVGHGETAKTIAAKYNISVSALRNLNTRTFFKKDFDHLQKGDILVVPARVAKKEAAVTNPEVTGYLNEAATFLSNGGTGRDLTDNIEARARSFFIGGTIGRANSSLEQWLDQYGTARIQLDVDEHFSLKNSQFDLLLPLWEQENRLFFTQGSFHRTDDRNQTNLGFGYRYFTAGYMVGGNVFFDYDLTRSHSRMGLGLEYVRDYLRFGVNSYIRLSEWRDSRDFDNYEERPANGWDIRAEAYLPSHPQLGFKLSWEQYYGDEVALFGKSSRQRNPYAVTFGANYTPFPLMTLSAEHREGASGKDDTRFGIQMTYRMGVPLRDQLDPGAVDGLRRLGGGRYDFVERNNNIVLEYREKKGIKLAMRREITGFAYEDHSLEMTVESKAGVSRIDVSAPELVAAGGKIIGGGVDPSGYHVVLPPYHGGGDTANTYTVTAIAYDAKNRASNQETARVVVKNVQVNAEQSTFAAEPLTIVISKPGADHKSHLKFTAFDGQGNPVSGLVADNKLEFVVEEMVSVQTADGVPAAIGEITETAAGVYEADLTGTKTGSYKVTPKSDGVFLGGIMLVIAFVNEGADIAVDGDDRSTFEAAPAMIYVEGIEDAVQVSKLKLKAVDTFNNPIQGLVEKGLTFAVADPAEAALDKLFTIGTVRETGKGIYETEFRARMAADYKIEPRLGGAAVHAQLFAKVAALADGGMPEGGSGDGRGEDGKSPETGVLMSTFVVTPKLIYVEGVEEQKTFVSQLTFTARDQYGNTLTGITADKLEFKAFVGADNRMADVTVANFRGTDGVYTADFSSNKAAAYRIEPYFDGAQVGGLYGDVHVSADGSRPDGGTGDGHGEDGRNPATGERMSTFVVSPKKIYVAGAANQTAFVSKLEFSARDSNGNPLTGITAARLQFRAFAGGEDKTADVTVANVTETDGVYTTEFSSNKAAAYRIEPYFDGAQVGGLYGDVHVSADGSPPDGGSGDGKGADGRNADTGAQMSTFEADPATIYIDAITGDVKHMSVIKFTARDKYGNDITNLAGKLKFVGIGKAHQTTVILEGAAISAKGNVYTASFSHNTVDEYVLQPQLDGERVGRLEISVQVLTSGENIAPDAEKSSFDATPLSIGRSLDGAGDQAKSVLTFTARDKYGNPIEDLELTKDKAQLVFEVTPVVDTAQDAGSALFDNTAPFYTVTDITKGAQTGTYTADFYGNLPGAYIITPKYMSRDGTGKQEYTARTVTIENPTSEDIDKSRSLFAAGPEAIMVSDGSQDNTAEYKYVSTLTFSVQDKYGNPITGLADSLEFVLTLPAGVPVGETMLSAITEQDKGSYTATFTSQKIGDYTFKPQLGKKEINGLQTTVNVSGDIASATVEVGAVTLDELGLGTKRTANATTDERFKFIATTVDRFNNVVKNAPVTWTSTLESGETGAFEDEAGRALSHSVSMTDAKGITVVYLRSKMNQSAVNVEVSAATDYMKTLPAPDNKTSADKTVTFVGYKIALKLRQTTISAKFQGLDGSATEVGTFMATPYPPNLQDDKFKDVDLTDMKGTTYSVESGLAAISAIIRNGAPVMVIRATSEASGTAVLKGTGTGTGVAGTAFNRIAYKGEAEIFIKPARRNGILGVKSGSEQVSLFGADTNYTFGARTGWIIDAIGAGGGGGGFVTVGSMDKVIAIETIWGEYIDTNPRRITVCQLTFKYEPGSGLPDVTIGGTKRDGLGNLVGCNGALTGKQTNHFDIPADETFLGVVSTQNSNNLVGSVEWVTIDRDVNR